MNILVKGPTVLADGTRGVVHQLYNEGELGLFQADNGPIFTIRPADLREKQPPLSAAQIVAELHRIFRAPLREGLQWY